jgi:hypothetical protein
LKNNNKKTRLVANPDALTLSRQPGPSKSEVTYQGPTGAFFFSGVEDARSATLEPRIKKGAACGRARKKYCSVSSQKLASSEC